jgi:Na+/alanine symporter
MKLWKVVLIYFFCFLFQKIQKQKSDSLKKRKLEKQLGMLAVRILISTLIIESVLHFTSIYSLIVYHKQLVHYFSKSSIILALYLVGSLFACKYIVYYGLSTMVNLLVGMKTTELPRCISLIHLNSELWRFKKFT